MCFLLIMMKTMFLQNTSLCLHIIFDLLFATTTIIT
jgi:hypothetical protein